MAAPQRRTELNTFVCALIRGMQSVPRPILRDTPPLVGFLRMRSVIVATKHSLMLRRPLKAGVSSLGHELHFTESRY